MFVEDLDGGPAREVAAGRAEDLRALLATFGTAATQLTPATVEGLPSVTILFAVPSFSPCAPQFEPIPACAHDVFTFYPAVGRVPAALAHVMTSEAVLRADGVAVGTRPVAPTDTEAYEGTTLVLEVLRELGVPVRIEAYAGMDSGAQALWVAGASLLGMALAGGAGLLLGRPRDVSARTERGAADARV